MSVHTISQEEAEALLRQCDELKKELEAIDVTHMFDGPEWDRLYAELEAIALVVEA